jgi:hypothetical protein
VLVLSGLGLACPEAIRAGTTWIEPFESYASGTFPSPLWINSGNNDVKIDNQVRFGGQSSLRLFGVVGSCWGALAHRALNTAPPYEIEFQVRNGSETLSGCHPDHGGVALNTGPSWTTPGRGLIRFNQQGEIRSSYEEGNQGAGIFLGAYVPGEWYRVKIRYGVVDADTVQLKFWINAQFRGSQNLPAKSAEANFAYLAITSNEGTAWFDNVKVTHLDALGPELLGLTPDQGGNSGQVTVTIATSGLDLAQPPTVKLVKAGESEIVGQGVAVNGNSIEARFDLTGRSLGTRDVVVIDAAGGESSLPGGFTVEEGVAPKLWVEIVGPAAIRPGRPQTFWVTYGNEGNMDAEEIPLWINGIPPDALWDLGRDLARPPEAPGLSDIDWEQVPVAIDAAGGTVSLPLFLARVPPGRVSTLPLSLTVVANRPQLKLHARIGSSLISSAAFANAFSSSSGSGAKCLEALFMVVLDLAVPPQEECFVGLLDYIRSLKSVADGEGVFSLVQVVVAGAGILIDCAQLVPQWALVVIVTKAVLDGIDLILECAPVLVGASAEATAAIVTSIDPNIKLGSRGAKEHNYIDPGRPLIYEIKFENLETASAPAQEVVITDHLDTANIEIDTLVLGPVTVGDHRVVPPLGSRALSTTMDLRPARNMLVHLEANVDATGLLTWRFTSIDPVGGGLPEDPFSGFLPPNLDPPAGEGSVLFTAMPKAGLPTGTEIRNRASITFDTNAPIETPEWVNTLDSAEPLSQVLPLASIQSLLDFEVGWSGADVGSGIKSYDLWVSEDGGPFNPWLTGTTETVAIFHGLSGRSYSFYSIARDWTDNLEEVPVVPDSATQVAMLPPIVQSISPNSGPTEGGTAVTISGSGFAVGATVQIGGVAPTDLEVESSTMITARTVPHATGAVDVTVTNPDGLGATLARSYFFHSPPPGGFDFFTLTPCRVVDTRWAQGPLGGPALAASQQRLLTATNACGIPPSAKALAINVTVVSPTDAGHLSLFPGNAFFLGTSAVTFSPGQTRASNAILLLATDGTGSLGILNVSGGSVHLVLDVYGYFE